MALKSPEGVHRPENYTNRFLLVQGTPEKYWSLAPLLDCCKIRYPSPRSKHRPGIRVTVAKLRLWVHNTVPTLSGGACMGIAGDARRERAPSPHVFHDLLHFSSLRSNWMSETMGVRQGQGKKNKLWSANRKFQTPSSPTLIPGLTLIPVLNPPPPPPPVEDWPLFQVDPYSGFYSWRNNEMKVNA